MMKRWLVAFLTLSLLLRAGAEELEWLTDVPTALAKAKAENKVVLLDFTGSDWCGWCKKLKAEVFDTPQFAAFAKVNFIMVELDFPHSHPQSDELKQANTALAEKYDVHGFPTVIVLNADGEQLSKDVGFIQAGLPGYIGKFETLPGVKHVDGGVATSTPPADDPPDPPRHAPVYAPLPHVAPVQYDDLALKGVSVGPAGRMAMINNETLAVGESASVKVRDGHVDVVVKEIRDDSALVTVDGKPVELKMRQD
jgi:thioredoxin-related protein